MEGSSPDADNFMAAESQKVQPVRKRHRVFGEKVCQVCGDKALAHHFGVLACETCKAFFRRNALKQDGRKCLFEGKCPVDKKTRRFCPPCRLKKCFSVGMQAGLILDEDERKERMQKVKEKQAKQQKSETESSSTNSSVCMVTTTGHDFSISLESLSPLDIATAVAVTHSETVGMTERETGAAKMVVKNLDYQTVGQTVSESMFESLQLASTISDSTTSPTASTQPPPSVAYSSQYLPMQAETEEQKFPGPCCRDAQKIVVPFEHVPRDQLPSDPYMYWRLSEEERRLLTKLSAAYQDTILSILNSNPPKDFVKFEDVTNECYFQECEIEVRNAISFAKRLEDFQKLHTNEQVALLKASTFQVLGLRNCALFVAEKNAWLTKSGYFTIEHGCILCPNHPFMEIGHSFCKVVKDIIKNDFTLYALLHCVILFDPCDERILDRQIVNSIRDKYIMLLRHYLESVYSYCHSEKYFLALLEKIHFYRGLTHEGRPLIKKFFPIITNQLLVEVMDLD